MRLALAGFLHEGGNEKIQVAYHGRLILNPHSACPEDVVHGVVHFLRVLGVVDGLFIREGEQRSQLVSADSIEPNPAVLPRLLNIGSIGIQLVGPDKKEIPWHEFPGFAARLKGSLACQNQMNQIVVPDTGPPGVAGRAALQAAVKDGKIHIVGIILLERLLINFRHKEPPF